ncbi:MAG: hypothetical protein PHU25_08995 [Deltaproteobacteria bacterium]|nr:hypothetical protein [Deltaproteobacteria bacterium]
MTERLSADELVALVKRVFDPGPDDHRLAILVDLPDERTPDSPAWAERREMAGEWARLLADRCGELGLKGASLLLYRNVRTNNADLPPTARAHDPAQPLPAVFEEPLPCAVPFDTVFETHGIFLAPTQFSATAPLKVAAGVHGFRAATMPGFCAAMIPALRLDYGVIGSRVAALKKLLDSAERACLRFEALGRSMRLELDLRHRSAHESSGVFTEPGAAGNLPSGEAYIVPYEGEIDGDPSRSEGELPVEFGSEIVVYKVRENMAVEVLTSGLASTREAGKLATEPAYGNLAELGLGVLGDFGIEPMGEILLDEKLGLHIAFGRSDHFGGRVGSASFKSPERVVHIDRVYTPSLQPRIRIAEVRLVMPDGKIVPLMKDGAYTVPFDA